MKKQIIKLFEYHNKSKIKKKISVGENFYCNRFARVINDGLPSNIKICDHVFLLGNLYSKYGGIISIGENVYIGSNTRIMALNNIQIGNNVIISDHITISDNNNHPIDPQLRMQMCQEEDYINSELWSWENSVDSNKIEIRDNVWIGQKSTILKGVVIGQGSIVACNSVVTHDVPEYTIVAGNPAKVVKYLGVNKDEKNIN